MTGEIATLEDATRERDRAFRQADIGSRQGARTPLPGVLLKVVRGDEFIASFEPPAFTLEPLIVQGQLASLTALPNGGKTTIAVLLILAAVGLVHAPGLEATECRGLYLIGENDVNLQVQLLAACEHYDIDPVLLRDRLWVIPQRFGLGTMVSEIASLAASAGGFGFVVVDTRIAYSDSLEENDNSQAAEDARALRDLTQIDGRPAVLALCHPPKNAGRDSLYPRGGSAFFGEIDCNLTLWGDDGTVELSSNKRRMPPFDPLRFELKQIDLQRTDSRGRPVRSVVAISVTELQGDAMARAARQDEDRVLFEILHHPSSTLSEWATNCGWASQAGPNKAKVHRVLQKLEAEKLVRKVRGRYSLTEAGKHEAGRVQ